MYLLVRMLTFSNFNLRGPQIMKAHLRALRVVVSAIVLCVALVSAAAAQEITGGIVGTVKDGNGAAVAGATVIA